MRSKCYIAMNMNDFNNNQHGAETEVQLLFISARNIGEAMDYCQKYHKKIAWSIIPKSQIDKTIVYQEN